MRTIDFTPFTRSAIGFDHLFELLNNQTTESVENYPPYDIVRTGEDTFRINLAVAGFAPSDINITAQQNLLIVSGRKTETEKAQYLYQGISARAFERRFNRRGRKCLVRERTASAQSRTKGAGSDEAAPDRNQRGNPDERKAVEQP